VTVPGVAQSGDQVQLTFPMTVEIDVSAVPANTAATLYFDLLGFGSIESFVTIDNVRLTGDLPPGLDWSLDPASDSGALDDGITNQVTVKLVGTTDAEQEVRREISGAEIGTTTADATGRFQFDDVPLE